MAMVQYEWSFLVFRYEKRLTRHCSSYKYGGNSTLAMAQSACNLDDSCMAVYDGSCDDSGTFFLCTRTEYDSRSPSCVYEKNGNSIFYIQRLISRYT